jgi:hypothetical protein
MKKLTTFLRNCLGFIRSLFILYLMRAKKARVFYGYQFFWFAKQYAEKRTKKWTAKLDQMGKRQAVLPYRNKSLIVCSQIELDILKKKRVIKREVNTRKLMEKAYYVTMN